MRNLNYRRKQKQKAKERALCQLRLINWKNPQWVTEKAVARRAAHHTACSCSMCGNPRRHRGEVTRQEMQAAIRCPEPDFTNIKYLYLGQNP